MKMVKSLLLGSAAGMVAIAGAQAADLPVKAKPVQYVKICTLYGDGFYYIPVPTPVSGSRAISGPTTATTSPAPVRRTTPVRPVRKTARPTTTRPGIVAASRSTPGRRLPTARCGRSRPSTCRTRTPRNRPTSPAGSSSGAASPSAGRCRSSTTKAASAIPACARCTSRSKRARPAPTAPTRSPIHGSWATASP